MTKYIVLEIQTNIDGTIGTLINSYSDRSLAESKYHQVLSAAAVSQLPVHSCVLLTNEGFLIESKVYKYQEPEPESNNE